MTTPINLVPLIDADIIRYETGFAAETGWSAITEEREKIPPFDYVKALLHQRIANICAIIGTKETPRLFITEGHTFRFDIAKTKPYKGTRKGNKPWHYRNLTVYLRDVLNAEVITGIEVDDQLAIEQLNPETQTIICSRDKDLRQIPGWFFSWELNRQPSFGPKFITADGTVELSDDRKKLNATGLAAFYGQVLTGDRVDNIPGLDKCGPVAAFSILNENREDMLSAVREAYDNDELLLEQGRLCWMVRKLNDDGSPVMWEIGMEE